MFILFVCFYGSRNPLCAIYTLVVWSHPPEPGWPTRRFTLKGNWLSLLQKPLPVHSSLGWDEGSWMPPCLKSGILMGMTLLCTVPALQVVRAVVLLCLGSTTYFNPPWSLALTIFPLLACNDPWALWAQRSWYGCPSCAGALCRQLSSALWPDLTFYVSLNPLANQSDFSDEVWESP